MFEKIKLHLADKRVMIGSADLALISLDEISELSESWKNPKGKLCKAGSSTVAYIFDGKFIKCSPAGKIKRALRKIFQMPRPVRTMIMAEKLKSLNIPTPEVYCAVREKRLFLPICDYLVTENLDTQKISFAHEYLYSAPAKRDEMFYACAMLLKKMHSSNIIHGDASMRNFYISENDGEIQAGVIDLDACRKVSNFAAQRAFIKEEARFLSSFIITCKLSEEPEQVADFCRQYTEEYKQDFQNSADSHKALLNLTLRYLERTRR